jgi:plastocyanin
MIGSTAATAATLVLFALLAAPACGAGAEGERTPAPAATTGQATEAAQPSEGSPAEEALPRIVVDPARAATVKGTAKFSGDPPKMRPIDFGADPVCKGLHGAERVFEEKIVVNRENGGLRYAFVRVTKGLPAGKFDPPADSVVLDQKGCMYTPHVFGIQTGQTLVIRNSDNTNHNIHGYPKKNEGFNFGQTTAGQEEERVFKFAETIPVKCDRHGWMEGYIHVMSHPYFATTDENGGFEIKNVPAGTYTIEAWHESLGTQTADVTVGESEEKTIEFTFEKKK